MRVTVELIGGAGALIRLFAAPGGAASLVDSCYGVNTWAYNPGSVTSASAGTRTLVVRCTNRGGCSAEGPAFESLRRQWAR